MRCGNSMCRSVEDPVHQEYLGSSIRYMNKVIFDQAKLGSLKGSCPDCSSPAATLVCPHCHNEIPKEMLMMVVPDEDKDLVVKTIIDTARTGDKGAFGDGKIFISPVEEVYTVSSGVKETAAGLEEVKV